MILKLDDADISNIQRKINERFEAYTRDVLTAFTTNFENVPQETWAKIKVDLPKKPTFAFFTTV